MSRVAQLDGTALDLQLTRALQADLGVSCPPLLVDTLVFLLGTKRWHQDSVATYGSILTGVGYQCSRLRLFLVTVVLRHLLHRFERTNLAYELLDLIHLLQFLSSGTGGPSLLHRVFRVGAVYEPGFLYGTSSSSSSEVQMLWNASIEMIAGLSFFNRMPSRASAEARTRLTVDGDRDGAAVTQSRTGRNKKCPSCGEAVTNAYRATCCNARYSYICALELENSRCLVCGAKNLRFVC